MRGLFVLVLMAGAGFTVQAAEVTQRTGWQPGDRVLPQDRDLPAGLAELAAAEEEIYGASVLVNVGLKSENPAWAMTRTHIPVMLERLFGLVNYEPTANDVLSMKARYNEPAYKGLELNLSRLDGKAFETLKVYNGRITAGGRLVAEDPGRLFEYWLWGTARIKREVVMGARILPILTFDQCRLTAQEVIDSLPRQCLLPDGDMLLDVKEPLTAASLRAKDFDGCLRHGVGIINTFPRRCVVPGGRVFVEPPRVIETPADAPLADGVSSAMPTTLPETAPALPTSTTVVVPGVGNFSVKTESVKVLSGTSVVISNSVLNNASGATGGTPGGETALVPVTATVVVPGVSVAVVVTGTAVVPARTQTSSSGGGVSVAVPLATGSPAPARNPVQTGADVKLGF